MDFTNAAHYGFYKCSSKHSDGEVIDKLKKDVKDQCFKGNVPDQNSRVSLTYWNRTFHFLFNNRFSFKFLIQLASEMTGENPQSKELPKEEKV